MAEYSHQDFKKGEVIMQEGDQPHCADILKSGSVEIVKKRSDGEDAILSVLKSGDIFGEMSMVDAEPRSATVRALEDVTLIVVDGPTFKLKQEALDVFSRNLVQTLIKRLREQNQQLADLLSPSQIMKAAKKGQISQGSADGKTVLVQENFRDKLNFGAIRFLIGDSNPQSRQGIKGGLHMQGFREIEDLNNSRDFGNKVSVEDYDLILMDGNLGVTQIAPVIKKIRQGATHVSPFAVIFAVIDQPDPSTLELLADAGLDDVLVKPVALGNIIDRVERRIKKRKPFVVTLEYVGPDRRSSKRSEGEQIPLVDVPNPLTFKAIGEISENDYAESVEMALRRLEDLKIERHAVQIDWLCGKIGSLVMDNQNPSYFMEKLVGFTKVLTNKLKKKSDDDHVRLCSDILSMVDDFEAGMAEMAGRDWDVFSALCKRLKAELGPQ